MKVAMCCAGAQMEMSVGSLLDAFVQSYRSLSQGLQPGVTIEPTSKQLARGLQEDDPMTV